MVRKYLDLTKPRLLLVNVLVAASVYIFASGDVIDWTSFFAVGAGLSLIVGSACIFNNIADRVMDAKMERTKNRALPTGAITPPQALLYGLVLFIGGVLLLHFYTNLLTLAMTLLGFIIYVFLYTPLKPRTGYALYVGAVAGAMPPLVGYAAAANTLDFYALGLFMILFLWQVPHFLAIARFRFDEYRAAGVPLLVSRPLTPEENVKARQMFRFSLVFLVALCVVLILHRWVR